MLRKVELVGWSAVALLVAACGGNTPSSPILPPEVAEGTNGGVPNTVNRGGKGGMGGATASAGPVITISAPAAVSKPSDSGVILEDQVTVVCVAEKASDAGATDINQGTVKIDILDAAGKVLQTLPGSPAAAPNSYEASFSVAGQHGRVSFQCSAEDRANPPKLGKGTVEVLVDQGPLVTIVSPKKDAAFPVTSAVHFEFSVAENPLASGASDAGDAITTTTLSVAGQQLSFSPKKDSPGTFEVDVDFTDKALFEQVPEGKVIVSITSANRRGASTLKTYEFLLDGTGPTINVTNPANNAVLAGDVSVAFEVKDTGAAVKPTDVTIRIGNEPAVAFDPSANWTNVLDKYTYKFNTRDSKDATVQITLNISAVDGVGNRTTVERTINLDYMAPYVSLDPPNVREQQRTSRQCSTSFDPLGNAAGDLSTTTAVGVFRALVWDQTNGAVGAQAAYYSLVNKSSVALFATPGGQPILRSSLNNGICDEVVPNSVQRDLKPIPGLGAAYYANTQADWGSSPAAASSCTVGNASQPPAFVCNGNSDMFYVMKHTVMTDEPVVYGGSTSSVECTGGQWDIAGALGAEGWVCLVATASDNLGNKAISKPIRVCVDNQVDPKPACAVSSTVPPTCTESCTLPVQNVPPQLLQMIQR